MPRIDRHLQVEYRPLEALISYVRNARTHSDEQVAQIASGKPRTLRWEAG